MAGDKSKESSKDQSLDSKKSKGRGLQGKLTSFPSESISFEDVVNPEVATGQKSQNMKVDCCEQRELFENENPPSLSSSEI